MKTLLTALFVFCLAFTSDAVACRGPQYPVSAEDSKLQPSHIAVRARIERSLAGEKQFNPIAGNAAIPVVYRLQIVKAPSDGSLAVGSIVLAVASAFPCESPHPGLSADGQEMFFALTPIGPGAFHIVGLGR
jgi:hypothetical protein